MSERKRGREGGRVGGGEGGIFKYRKTSFNYNRVGILLRNYENSENEPHECGYENRDRFVRIQCSIQKYLIEWSRLRYRGRSLLSMISH